MLASVVSASPYSLSTPRPVLSSDEVLGVAQVLHHDEAAPRIRGMHVRHVRAGLLEQRRHLEIGRDVFLARRRVHDDERVGLRRPGGRVDVAARDAKVAAEARVGGCHADATDAPSQVACQPSPDEGEARVVLEHSHKYSAQHCARDLDQGRDSRPRTFAAACVRASACRRASLPRAARSRVTRRAEAGHARPRIPPTSPSPSRATTTTSSSTSTAMPGCAATSRCARETGTSAPTASNTTPGPERQAQRRHRIHRSPARGARQRRHLFADAGRGLPRHRVRAAGTRRARRGPQPARRRQRQGHAGGRHLHHLPRRTGRLADQGEARSSSTRARATAPGAAPRWSSRACRSSTRPGSAFPLGPQRKSGFLFPSSARSSRNGAVSQVPYYWNIRPNLDFTAEPVYYSKRGVDLAGELRYLTRRQRGSFEFNYLPNDDVADRDRSRVTLEPRRRAARRMALAHRRHRRQRHRLLRGLRARPGRHQRAVRRAPRGDHLPRRALQRARPVPGFPDHRRRARRPRTAPTRARRACWRRATGTRGWAASTTASTPSGELRPRHRRHRLAPRRGAARRPRLVGAGILRASLGGLSLHAVLARGPGRRQPTIRRRARCRSPRSTRAWCSSAAPARTASAA